MKACIVCVASPWVLLLLFLWLSFFLVVVMELLRERWRDAHAQGIFLGYF